MIGIRDARPRRLSARLAGQRTRGQAFVELALVAPVLLMLVLAGIDLGRLFYAQIAVTNAAREGAMVAAETPSSYSAGNGCDSVTNAVMCAVLNEGQGFVNVTPADVAMSCTPACVKAYGNKVTVTVTGHFTVLTPIIWAFTGGQDVTFERVATADIVVIPAFVGATPTPVPTVTPDPSTSPEPTATPEPTPTPVPCAPPFVDFNHSQQNKNWPVVFTSIATPTSGACMITFYRWDFGDGQTDAGGTLNSVSHDYGSANQGVTFTVTLTVTTPSGTYSASKPVTTKS